MPIFVIIITHAQEQWQFTKKEYNRTSIEYVNTWPFSDIGVIIMTDNASFMTNVRHFVNTDVQVGKIYEYYVCLSIVITIILLFVIIYYFIIIYFISLFYILCLIFNNSCMLMEASLQESCMELR